MSKRTIHGIDLTAPGGIEKLFAVHRATFGDAVMEADPEAAAAAEAEAKAAADSAAAKAADEKLGEGGIKALKAEREAREAAEKELAEFRAEKQKAADAELSEVQRVQKERDDQAAENAKLKATNARLAALAEHPVPKEYQDLVAGTDEASYLASAKKISELYARAEGKSGVVHKSGTSSGDKNSASGSIDAGRELYASRKKK